MTNLELKPRHAIPGFSDLFPWVGLKDRGQDIPDGQCGQRAESLLSALQPFWQIQQTHRMRGECQLCIPVYSESRLWISGTGRGIFILPEFFCVSSDTFSHFWETIYCPALNDYIKSTQYFFIVLVSTHFSPSLIWREEGAALYWAVKCAQMRL